METPFVIAFVVAAIFAGLELANDQWKKKPIAVGVLTFLFSAVANYGITILVMPYFTHLLADGYPWLFFLDMIVGLIVSGLANSAEGRSFVLQCSLGASLLVIYLIVAFQLTPPGLICDNGGHKQLAQLLPVEQATGSYPDLDLNNLIKVAPETAFKASQGALGNNLGSYLMPAGPTCTCCKPPVGSASTSMSSTSAFNRISGLLFSSVAASSPVTFSLAPTIPTFPLIRASAIKSATSQTVASSKI